MYDACMHGGSRKKAQRIRSSISFASIERLCDGGHKHAPWKRSRKLFTAEEAEYTEVLCLRLAEVICNDAQVLSIDPSFDDNCLWAAAKVVTRANKKKEDNVDIVLTQPTHHSGVGLQGRVPEAIVPEYKRIEEVRWPGTTPEEAENVISDISDKKFLNHSLYINGKIINKGHRVIDFREGGNERRPEAVLEIGVPWTPQEFTERALSVDHPFAQAASAPDSVRCAVFRLLVNGPTKTKEKRK